MTYTLQRRITVAFALLSVVAGGLFAAIVYVAIENYEDRTFPEQMVRDFAWLSEMTRAQQPVVLPPSYQHWVGADIPAAYAKLGSGYHHVETADEDRHVMVGDIGGDRHVITYENLHFEGLEERLAAWLGVGWIVSVGATIWLATLTANRVIQPVRDLAHAVRQDRAANDLPMLEASDEIGELARAFAARAETLQKFLERERLFTADVSHELRTPLTVILGAAEVLQLRAAQGGDQPSLDAIERILRTGRDASAMVTAFLLLARSPNDAGAPPVALQPLLERDVEQQRVWLRDKAVRLEVRIEARPIVHGAPELLAAAIGNLVRNACQYTTEGAVTVTLRSDRVVVEDTGPGMGSTAQGPTLHSRPGSERPSATGEGRGLSIVYRVAEYLGWQVLYEPSPSGGSRFTVLFAPG